MMIRMGDVLVNQGTLTSAQRDEVVTAQQNSQRPFGVLVEEMFGVSPECLEAAWAEQFSHHAPWVTPVDEAVDAAVQQLVNRRQAWQFKLVPLRMEDGEILVATSKQHLARALRFASRSIGPSCTLVLCEDGELLDALERFYPLAGAREHAGAGEK